MIALVSIGPTVFFYAALYCVSSMVTDYLHACATFGVGMPQP